MPQKVTQFCVGYPVDQLVNGQFEVVLQHMGEPLQIGARIDGQSYQMRFVAFDQREQHRFVVQIRRIQITAGPNEQFDDRVLTVEVGQMDRCKRSRVGFFVFQIAAIVD